jgi:hypothetical protein
MCKKREGPRGASPARCQGSLSIGNEHGAEGDSGGPAGRGSEGGDGDGRVGLQRPREMTPQRGGHVAELKHRRCTRNGGGEAAASLVSN